MLTIHIQNHIQVLGFHYHAWWKCLPDNSLVGGEFTNVKWIMKWNNDISQPYFAAEQFFLTNTWLISTSAKDYVAACNRSILHLKLFLKIWLFSFQCTLGLNGYTRFRISTPALARASSKSILPSWSKLSWLYTRSKFNQSHLQTKIAQTTFKMKKK